MENRGKSIYLKLVKNKKITLMIKELFDLLHFVDKNQVNHYDIEITNKTTAYFTVKLK